jgi:hypothetical protein
MSTSVPDNLTTVINPPNAIPGAQPTDVIIWVAQLQDAMNKLKDGTPEKKMAER